MGKGSPFKVVTNAIREAGQATGLVQKAPKLPKPPQIKKPTGPRQFTRDELSGIAGQIKPKGLMAPKHLGAMEGMDPLQKRTAYASQAVSGSGGIGDKQGLAFYRNTAIKSILDGGSPTDIERQLVQEGLGEKILGNSNEDFLSALERAYRRM